MMTKSEYEAALKRIDVIFHAKGGTPEGAELGRLISQVEQYEEIHYPMDLCAPRYFKSLEVDEVFGFYDMPLTFTSKSPTGAIYLVEWIGEDDESRTWLYVPISEKRLGVLKRGEMDLRSAFTDGEFEELFKVRVIDSSKDEMEVKKISASDLTDDDLPEAGVLLKEAAQ